MRFSTSRSSPMPSRGRGTLAYQYCVVMKYLDNLIAWGDNLFQQDTVESINEATQLYVLAANILGARPQRIPPRGTVKPKTFAQLKTEGLGPIGNALVELGRPVPAQSCRPRLPAPATAAACQPLFGIGRTLYFCIPRNDKMLGYWDTVADRLFKIRHCMNIEGVVRPLALFDPPIDPGMLVKAAAAGIDIGSIVSGLNQPIGPVRCLTLIQKALELCGEVRGLGSALLSALEKGDGEHLALLRQGHEIQIQKMAQEVRFLQWKAGAGGDRHRCSPAGPRLWSGSTTTSGCSALPADQNCPGHLHARPAASLTEENFDEAYATLVGQYDKTLTLQPLPALNAAPATHHRGSSRARRDQGGCILNTNEDAELNEHLPDAKRDQRHGASRSQADRIRAWLSIPDLDREYAFLGDGRDD